MVWENRCCRVAVFAVALASTPVFAEVEEIAANEIVAYVRANPDVVVQFTSPDTGCGFCVGANQPFDQAESMVRGKAKFARVQWSPWVKFPPDIKPIFPGRGIPTQLVYKNGKPVGEVTGKIKDVRAFVRDLPL
jgi:hypothetical protein